jgi:hypothetical protein
VKILVITEIPPRQALLGVTPAKIIVEESEVESLDEAVQGVHVPLGGQVRIVPMESVTTVRSKVINEVAPK